MNYKLPKFKKLTGSLKQLFINISSSIKDNAYSIEGSDRFEIPLFGFLSIQQKLELISEMYSGFCCKKTRLPQNTLINYATLFSFYEILVKLFENEISDEKRVTNKDCNHYVIEKNKNDLKEEEEDDNAYHNAREKRNNDKEKKKFLKEISKIKKKKKLTDDFKLNFRYETEKGKIDEKKERKFFLKSMNRIEKTSSKVIENEMKRSLKSGRGKGKGKGKGKRKRNCDYETKFFKTVFSKHHKIGYKNNNSEDCLCFNFRKLLSKLLGYFLKKNVHPTLFSYRKNSFWTDAISFIKYKHLSVVLGSSEEIIDELNQLLWGLLDNSPKEKVRYDFTLKLITKVNKNFENKWKLSKTLKSLAIISVGIGENVLGPPPAFTESMRFQIINIWHENIGILKSEQQLLNEHSPNLVKINILDDLNPELMTKIGMKSMHQLKNYKSSLFFSNFHIAMKNRNYKNLDDRYEAIMSLDDDYVFMTCDSANLNDIFKPPIHSINEELYQKLWSCGYEQCCKQETLSNKFQVCSGCKIERYCSAKCQKSDCKFINDL